MPGMLVRVYEFLEEDLHAGYVSTVSELQGGELYVGNGRIMNCWKKICTLDMLVQAYGPQEGDFHAVYVRRDYESWEGELHVGYVCMGL